MASHWQPAFSVIWILSPLIPPPPPPQKKNPVNIGPPLAKLSGSEHVGIQKNPLNETVLLSTSEGLMFRLIDKKLITILFIITYCMITWNLKCTCICNNPTKGDGEHISFSLDSICEWNNLRNFVQCLTISFCFNRLTVWA